MEPRRQPYRVGIGGPGGVSVHYGEYGRQVRDVVVAPVRLGPAAQQVGACVLGGGTVDTRWQRGSPASEQIRPGGHAALPYGARHLHPGSHVP
ncbi:MAG TPA: hypothetical protein VFB84_09210 [Micromonosporaceae bacterium]|nr:hypothetical protein [Micromonosporaceae bacterium]